jgi:hypothetical protein
LNLTNEKNVVQAVLSLFGISFIFGGEAFTLEAEGEGGAERST